MDKLEGILPVLDMKLLGYRYDLGLMCFKARPEIVLYAHIVQLSKQQTKINIAPGLSNLKERAPSEVPELTIIKVLNKLQIELEN